MQTLEIDNQKKQDMKKSFLDEKAGKSIRI